VGSGAGTTIALQRYTPAGFVRVDWSRVAQREQGTFAVDSVVNRRDTDVQHVLGAQIRRSRGRYDVTAGLAWTYEFNRNFVGDRSNLGAQLSVRAPLP
jgi:hypothetical protein